MTPSKMIKQAWRNASPGISLKQWAREQVKKGDIEAKQWFTNKGPDAENVAKASREARVATKKAKSGGK